LHTQGTLIVNEQDTIVSLRGAAFMGYEFGALNSHSYADYQKLAGLGFNVARLSVAWAYIEPKPGRYDTQYLSYVDQDIAWAKSLGLYIVLDMHQVYWSSQFKTDDGNIGNGMPIWMTGNYSSDQEGRLSSVTNFWESPLLRERFQLMWQFVASRYVNEPTVAGYDLLNEPPAGNISIDEFVNTTLPQFYLDTIAAVRQVDPKHMIFYEPPWEAPDRQVKIAADNIVFAPHFYFLALGDEYDGPISTLEWYISRQTQGLQVPVWIGEFGAYTKTQGYQNWIRDAMSLFDKYHVVGWSWWTYYKDDDNSMCLAYSNGTLRTELTTLLETGS
jgi:endoglycosylceramidase